VKEKAFEGVWFFVQWIVLSRVAFHLGYEPLAIIICAWHVVGFIQFHYCENDYNLLTSRAVAFNTLWFIALVMTIAINTLVISALLGVMFLVSRWILFGGENESCMKYEDIKKHLAIA